MAGVRLAVGLALLVLACGGASERVPEALCGRWESKAPGYVGRPLLLSGRSVVFVSSPTESENFAIRGVQTHAESDGSLSAEIAYGPASEQRALRVRLYATKPPTLAIGDRAERWTRVPGSERLP
jgi:hypothetical protein